MRSNLSQRFLSSIIKVEKESFAIAQRTGVLIRPLSIRFFDSPLLLHNDDYDTYLHTPLADDACAKTFASRQLTEVSKVATDMVGWFGRQVKNKRCGVSRSKLEDWKLEGLVPVSRSD